MLGFQMLLLCSVLFDAESVLDRKIAEEIARTSGQVAGLVLLNTEYAEARTDVAASGESIPFEFTWMNSKWRLDMWTIAGDIARVESDGRFTRTSNHNWDLSTDPEARTDKMGSEYRREVWLKQILTDNVLFPLSEGRVIDTVMFHKIFNVSVCTEVGIDSIACFDISSRVGSTQRIRWGIDRSSMALVHKTFVESESNACMDCAAAPMNLSFRLSKDSWIPESVIAFTPSASERLWEVHNLHPITKPDVFLELERLSLRRDKETLLESPPILDSLWHGITSWF